MQLGGFLSDVSNSGGIRSHIRIVQGFDGGREMVERVYLRYPRGTIDN